MREILAFGVDLLAFLTWDCGGEFSFSGKVCGLEIFVVVGFAILLAMQFCDGNLLYRG